jgi:hypothetical protein
MRLISGLALLAGFYPMACAISAKRRTTLRHALAWASVAWAAWTIAALFPGNVVAGYIALVLSACAGIAVLGARRPGVGAWNFVVGGLLAVLLLPVASGLGAPRLEAPHLIFPGAILLVVVINYVPTTEVVAALLAGAALAMEFARVAGVAVPEAVLHAGRLFLALSPWIALWELRRMRPRRDVDRMWLAFRDSYGILWAHRVREQFNRSTASSGREERLGWNGLLPPSESGEQAVITLSALLKRFGTPTESDEALKRTATSDDLNGRA